MEMYTKQKLLFDQQANEHEMLLAELKKLQITIDRKEKEMNKQTQQILNMNKEIYALEKTSPKNAVQEVDISNHKEHLKINEMVVEQRSHLDILNNELFDLQKHNDKLKSELLIKIKQTSKLEEKVKKYVDYS